MYSLEEIIANLPELDCHPAADRLPMMNEDKLESLKLDITINGIINPIWIIDKQIVDGRARYHVLRWLKKSGNLSFEPDIREWSNPSDDVDALVRSLNVHRNDYNSQQRAVYAAKYLVPKLKEEALQRMRKQIPLDLFPDMEKGNANLLAARQTGTNEKYVQHACQIQKTNDELLDFVMMKQMTLQDGLAFIKLKPEQQEFLFNQLKNKHSYKLAVDAYEKQHPSTVKPANKEPESISEGAPSDQTLKRVRKIEKDNINSSHSSLDMIFPMKIHENALEEIVHVLHRHGYADIPYRIWLTDNSLDVQEKLAPLLPQLAIAAYEVEPLDGVETID